MIAPSTKLEAANQVLRCFAPGARIERRIAGGWNVCWKDSRGKPIRKHWQTKGQDFYPVWSWPHGGTATTALSQLIRFLQGRPVFGQPTWNYWRSERIQLRVSDEALEALIQAGYPNEIHCCLCDRHLTGQLDWWSLDGVSGPCCTHYEGCRQEDVR